MREARAEQRLELLQAQLVLVEGVLLPRRLRVDAAVGRRHDQQAAGREDALDPVEHRVVRFEVLDHLEGHDGAEAARVEAVELERRADGELQVGRRVVELGVVDRDRVDVDAGDGRRLAGEDRAAEALAAAEVEHLPRGHDLRRPQIAVVVLVGDLDVRCPRDAALAGPVDETRRSRSAFDGHRVRTLATTCAPAGPAVATMPAVRFGPGQIRGGAARLWHAHGVAVVSGVALVVFAACFAWHWRLPGLYMDAVNPEYLLPGILEPPAPFDLAIPGNRLDGWPVFTGTVYHGSVQLYAALPFAAVLGSDLSTFRIVQMLVGALILVLVVGLAARPYGVKPVLAASVAAVIAVEPAFVMALRTQAYSCMFPLVLLLPCVLLLLRGRGGRVPQWLLVGGAGVLFGLAAFSYFIYWFFAPALLWLVLAERGARLPRLGAFAVGSAVGLLPFALGMLLLRDDVGGTQQLVDWLRDNREGLDPGQDDQGVLGRVEVVWRESRYVFAGQWPWAMILQESRTAALEGLKATLLVVLPVVALLPWFADRAGGGWSACRSRSRRRSASARCSSAAGSTAITTRPCCRSSTPRSAPAARSSCRAATAPGLSSGRRRRRCAPRSSPRRSRSSS